MDERTRARQRRGARGARGATQAPRKRPPDEEELRLRKRFGEVIRIYRKRLHFTQQDLASAVRISVTTLSNIENGEQMPSWSLGERLQRFLGIDISLAYLESEEDRLLV